MEINNDLKNLIFEFANYYKCHRCHKYKWMDMELNSKPICNLCVMSLLHFVYHGLHIQHLSSVKSQVITRRV